MDFYNLVENGKQLECTECKKKLSGSNKNNIVRHYKLVHKKEIVISKRKRNDESSVVPAAKKVKLSAKINFDKSKFLKCCVGLVAVRNLPFRIFDDRDYFKTLISPLEEVFETNLNSKNIVKVLESTSNKIQQSIKSKIKNQMVSLKLDIATRLDRSILGINIQYIKNSTICINTLGMIHLQKRHKATYLKDEILKCLKSYDIDLSQIYSTTTDNGANVIKVGKILQELQLDQNMEEEEEEDEETDGNDSIDENIHNSLTALLSVVRCAAHTIQLAAYDVIKNLESKIGECRKVIKKIRNLVRAGGVDKQMPVLDNATRWNSVYEMMKSLQNLKEFIESEFFYSTDIQSEIDWDFVSDFVVSFAPLAICTTQLQKEQYIMGDFYRDWLTCEIELEDLGSPTALLLHQAMQKRKTMLLENDAFVSALYLDPRFNFKSSTIFSEEQKTRALTHLVKTFNTMQKLENSNTHTVSLSQSASNTPGENEEQPTTSSSTYAKLTQRLIISAANTPKSAETQRTFKQKLMLLSNTNMVAMDTDILDYWKNTSLDKDIFKVMTVVLAVPASQVSVERSFTRRLHDQVFVSKFQSIY